MNTTDIDTEGYNESDILKAALLHLLRTHHISKHSVEELKRIASDNNSDKNIVDSAISVIRAREALLIVNTSSIFAH